MTAPRRKAAQGLDKIPSHEKEWLDMIQKYGLQQRTLEQLQMEGSFSASTVSKEAFLSVRCIWPEKKKPEDALMYITNLEYFFSEDHSDDAAKLMNRDLLGFDKVKTLYHIICTPKKLCRRTPSEYSGTLGDGLGPFSLLVNLYNQLQDRSIQASIDKRHQLGGAPAKTGFYDAMQPSAHADPTSPTRQVILSEGFDMEDIEMTDFGCQPAAGSSPRTPSPHARPPAAPPVTGPAEEEPPRRTPTETLVADFMVTLLGGLASLVQPLNPRPLCMANSFETTYRFGPIHNTSQQLGDVQFRARIDGSIPYSVSLAGIPREAAIFEAKRAARTDSGHSIPVLAQQSMEHIAYIWKCHENDLRVIPPLILVIGTYDSTYLEYIFGPGFTRVLPAQGKGQFLEIQEFGPFLATDEGDLDEFLHVMLSFILWQLERTDAATAFKTALS
ncbi:hypothetical protein EMCG_05185 [[Emmonsia] crescens]|uniref:Uncharacterized protein n=1 Tax=[Emmonsia] crescens TaxID=73230 RepID=A0A0G2HPQ1_9EURO|nr:hypothetical protein EMCG_05185 [Emmonsia crescens UAMH 3008]